MFWGESKVWTELVRKEESIGSGKGCSKIYSMTCACGCIGSYCSAVVDSMAAHQVHSLNVMSASLRRGYRYTWRRVLRKLEDLFKLCS